MPSLPGIFQIGSYDMVVLQVLLLAGIIGALTAKAKGRSGILWFVLSVVTCGAGILVVLFMPAVAQPSGDAADKEAGEKADVTQQSGSDASDA
ncbi:MAG: hypothetical protein N4A65_16240 [Cohaesibacter sp.]|jgi:Na+/H+-dicarboxylate symporter|nr:hypothetical protein [Cohaesibacter sp.]